MHLHLKKGEKIYINGAVLRVDQRCSIELMNNVTFLLENHVMQAEKATTPLRQLYFVVQTMLMEPENAHLTRELYWHQSGCLHAALRSRDIIAGLASADDCIKSQRFFDALKIIRNLFPAEARLLAGTAEREVA
jgi:flagellar protein FlbT